MTDSDELVAARKEVIRRAPNAPDDDRELAAKRLANYLTDTYWKGRFFRSRPVPAFYASGAASIVEGYITLVPEPDDE